VAYFAEIDNDGTVLRVISVSNADAPDPAPEHSEPLGQAFIASLGIEGEWRQTSYNGNFRKQYAPVGGRYLSDADVFIWPQPYPSWTLDANYDCQPPTPYPTDGKEYRWDEDTLSWVEVTPES
jgi:hypothetical protein